VSWAAALQVARDDLQRLITAHPELESAGRSLARVLEAVFARPAVGLVPELTEAYDERDSSMTRIHAAWEEGLPVLERVVKLADTGPALAVPVLAIARALQEDGSPAVDRLCTSIQLEPECVSAWVKLLLGPDEGAFEQEMIERGLEQRLVESVLRLVLLPELAEWSGRLCGRLTDGSWAHGYCPICGSAPALAESRGLEQRRRLRCDRCAADWPGQQVRCPFCGQADHSQLRYSFVEGEQARFRLALCDRCGGRLKVVATIAALSPPGLLVAELAAIHLDYIDDARAAAAGSP
jgi:FdhE protein